MNTTNIPFSIPETRSILKRTPKVLHALLSDLHEPWISNTEGNGTWSPYDIVGHLIQGEKTDWIPRAMIIIKEGLNGTFVPFDRNAQFKQSHEKNLSLLLDEFSELRTKNLKALDAFEITDEQLELCSNHPDLGVVNLKQLLSTWTAHDLVHLNQITRVMAKQYKPETGPWAQYMNLFQ